MVTRISLVSDPEVPISSMVVVPVGARLVALHVRVTFVLPFAGGVTGLAEAVAETSVGNSFTLNVTAEWNPPTLVTVRVVDTLPSSSIVNEEGDKDRVKFFDAEEALTVRAMVVVALRLPEGPVMVTVDVPVVAVLLAVSVNTLVPVGGLVRNAAVTPLGSPDAASVTLPVNPFLSVTEIVLVPLLPCVTDRLLGEDESVKLCVAVALTVKAIEVVAVRLPEVPVIVTVAAPVVAVALAVSVSTLVPVVGFVPNAAVTPLGRPDAASVTLPVNPFLSVTVIVLVPLLPWVTDRLLGESESVKLAVAVAFTVRETVVVAVRLPEVPVIVTVEVPVVAVGLAVSVSTLGPLVGVVPNAAVTPLGRPDAARVTLPVNPPTSVTVMVLVPLLPCVIDRLLGESESVKLGVEDPANRLMIPVVFGLPKPVHRS